MSTRTNYYKLLHEVKKCYERGENILHFFQKSFGISYNTSQAIQISYDFQTGSYINYIISNSDKVDKYTNELAEIINGLGHFNSIMEAGIGEATTMGELLPKLKTQTAAPFGFDISWSRIKLANAFLAKKHLSCNLFMGDLFSIPLEDNSIDVVYTSHSIEPNGGREEELLNELFRVAKRYVVLVEPIYELSSDEAKKRMELHGYVRGLKATAERLGMKVKQYRLLNSLQTPLNPSGLILIEKTTTESSTEVIYRCPNSGNPMKREDDCFYCPESMLVYPIISGIPCLIDSSAILASKYDVSFEDILS